MNMRKLWSVALLCLAAAAPVWSQQTGSISGQVTSPDGDGLPGVIVSAAGDVLPQAATTETASDGSYRLPLLPPGNYTLTFSLEGLAPVTRGAKVALGSNTALDVNMSPEALAESVNVVAEASLVDATTSELKATAGSEVIESLPVGQDYRELQKLIPGVQYSELIIRGPSGGGSGQDNVYLYDGVNVNLPLFGTLSTEPSSLDVDQVSFIKGGAKALDFNRAAGFTMNSISKSGTNSFKVNASYQVQPSGLSADQKTSTPNFFDEDKDWADISLSGPILRDKLFFYTSYYRPTVSHDNGVNVYGTLPDYKSTRDEFFGRLSFQPTSNLLIHGSYRDSDRDVEHDQLAANAAGSTSTGADISLKIAIAEANWVINNDAYATFKYTDFQNLSLGLPDTLFDFSPSAAPGTHLDIGSLDTQGRLTVPSLRPGETAYNTFIAPYLQRYGYVNNGVLTGGGFVGGALEINDQDFFRTNYQGALNWMLGSNVVHELHVGYQWYKDEEDLDRVSNGWGDISIPGGRITSSGKPVYFQALVLQTGVTGLGDSLPIIHSEFESQNVELNDTIRWGNWAFNAGLMISDDQLFGQGLREGGNTPSGFELCSTCKYKMYEVDFGDQIQPRLGATWAYNGHDTLFTSYARYNPAASSLPRAASWARNLASTRTANFDINGNLIDIQTLAASTGKFFASDLDPRSTDEYLVGTSRQFSPNLSARASARYRKSYNFWEDTNNDARRFINAPADISHELYIPDLSQLQQGIGGSSYVIAELDNAFNKYYDVSLEADWRGSNYFVRGSYVWSHYYGNFDQDNTNGDPVIDNDFNTFIGSSNMADGPGRQIWDMKYGNLHGDRRHQLKLYGSYDLKWNASVGAFAIYQSGAPWEAWDVEVYRPVLKAINSSSTSNTIRFAEPAGSRTTPAHYQLDLNYIQNFRFGEGFNIQLRADIYNAFDQQTGYAPYPIITNTARFGDFTRYYNPRRIQLGVRFQI